ncbi:hypothetical protein OCS65_12980 [Rhodococcus aetherivorans]|uniref:Uncharacterized protein n=1 Tax=Rhodococcus aetherivorans TaxID=191292 RepID=A0AA46PZ58_9NOCA|nr:hypothetical protein [Rhodococcus aetherivorans]UYF96596.1 hypothetical protein OCS65_12980 [Rhodococcus aetherivorans]
MKDDNRSNAHSYPSLSPKGLTVSTDRFVDHTEASPIVWWGDGIETDVQLNLRFVAGPDLTIFLTYWDARDLAEALWKVAAAVRGTVEFVEEHEELAIEMVAPDADVAQEQDGVDPGSLY